MGSEVPLEFYKQYNFSSNSKHVMTRPGVVDYKGKYWKGYIFLKKSPPKIISQSVVNPLQS